MAKKENAQLYKVSRKLNLWSWIGYGTLLVSVLIMSGWFPEILEANLVVTQSDGLYSVVFFGITLVVSILSLAIKSTEFAFRRGYRSNPINLILDPLLIPKLQQRSSTFSLFSIVLSLAVLLYLFGFVALIFRFFSEVIFPGVTDLVNMILSNLVNWALSGVIGNLIYDWMKKMISKQTSDRASSESKSAQ